MSIDERGRLEYLIKNTSYGLPYLMETWQDPLGIPPAVWATATGGTGPGTVTWSIAEEPYHKVILAGAGNDDDTSRLYTVWQWQLAPGLWGINTFNKLLIMEWEVKMANVSEMDNATCFLGLSAVNNATRASDDIAGFILTGDALNCISDNGGSETVAAVGGPTLTNWNKLAIISYRNVIEFWVNEAMQARHTTTPAPDEDLPDINAHGMFYLDQEALGTGLAEIHIGEVSIRPGVLL